MNKVYYLCSTCLVTFALSANANVHYSKDDLLASTKSISVAKSPLSFAEFESNLTPQPSLSNAHSAPSI